jgi:radical SAM protein with 4Fe4S-binding SPASM domain
MNPQFFSLVDVLAERKIQCEFFSNGTLLTAKNRQAILDRPIIDLAIISCDGAEKATFENLRAGADFEDWKQSVRELAAAAKSNPARNLHLSLNAVVSRQNIEEIDDIVRLAAALGIDRVGVLHPIPADDAAAELCPTPEELATLRRADLSALARSLGLEVFFFFRRTSPLPRLTLRCLQPWEYVFLRANGDVAPCCAIFHSDEANLMGNVFEQSFGEIWHGERFREFRRTSAAGTNRFCRICPYY